MAKYASKELHEKAIKCAIYYLEEKGYEVLERNPKYFDIILKENDSIIFVFVRATQNQAKGFPSIKIIQSKQSKAEIAAFKYCEELAEHNNYVRFDCIDFIVGEKDTALLRHHKACFENHTEE